MRKLPVDKRGYPVPVIVQRSDDGTPLFAVNNTQESRRCVLRKLCAICGERLTRELWFVGGPLSAFHPGGYFLDSALHHECMTYALRVCPYLAMARFSMADPYATLESAQARVGDRVYLADPSQSKDKPTVFVAVKAYGQSLKDEGNGHAFKIAPLRPYHAVEFWRHGERLTWSDGLTLTQAWCRRSRAPFPEIEICNALRLIEDRS